MESKEPGVRAGRRGQMRAPGVAAGSPDQAHRGFCERTRWVTVRRLQLRSSDPSFFRPAGARRVSPGEDGGEESQA